MALGIALLAGILAGLYPTWRICRVQPAALPEDAVTNRTESAVMEIRPILSAMLRNRTGAILVALQIAITLAVVTNAVFIIKQRVEKIGRPSGMDTDNLIFVQSYGYRPDYNHRVTIEEDLAMIRGTPGVVSASTITGIPLSGGGSSTSYKVSPDKSSPDVPGIITSSTSTA